MKGRWKEKKVRSLCCAPLGTSCRRVTTELGYEQSGLWLTGGTLAYTLGFVVNIICYVQSSLHCSEPSVESSLYWYM